ncbi:MAG: type II secretion system F family protein, partial [Candidatus Scalindua sp.]|nr:type II secretion system F family protein [Candidatus Scalindua sp.]
MKAFGITIGKANNKISLTGIKKKAFFSMLKGFVDKGFGSAQAIELIYHSESIGELKSALKKIIARMKDGEKIHDLFREFGMITNLEYTILDNAKNFKDALQAVISIGGNQNEFNVLMAGILISPLIFIYIAFGAMIGGTGMVLQMKEMLDMRSKAMGLGDPGISLPFYMEYPDAPYYFIIGFTSFLVISVIIYAYNYRHNTKFIYKILPIKAILDSQYIFGLINKLRTSQGAPMSKISQILKKEITPRGLSKLFSEIERNLASASDIGLNKEENKKHTMYAQFKRFNFPDIFISLIRSGETTRDPWTAFEQVESASIIMYDSKKEMLKERWGKIMK